MSLDQTEVLSNLINQRQELESGITKLQGQLEQAKQQYLKLTGAIDVLQQLNAPEEESVKEE